MKSYRPRESKLPSKTRTRRRTPPRAPPWTVTTSAAPAARTTSTWTRSSPSTSRMSEVVGLPKERGGEHAYGEPPKKGVPAYGEVPGGRLERTLVPGRFQKQAARILMKVFYAARSPDSTFCARWLAWPVRSHDGQRSATASSFVLWATSKRRCPDVRWGGFQMPQPALVSTRILTPTSQAVRKPRDRPQGSSQQSKAQDHFPCGRDLQEAEMRVTFHAGGRDRSRRARSPADRDPIERSLGQHICQSCLPGG